MKVYSIRNWNERFEKSQTRECKEMRWVPLPVAHDGLGFRRVMAHENGAAIYGAWVLIVQVAAQCPSRGTLADERGPLTPEDLALKTGCPERVLSEAIEVLSSKRIAWIDEADCQSDASVPSLQDKTGQYKTKEKSAPPEGGCPQGLLLWISWWNGLRAEGLVPAGVNETAPSKAVVKAYKRVAKTKELRDLFADRGAIEKAIREAPFLRSGWFRLEKLFGGSNREGELVIRKLLEGGYADQKPGGRSAAAAKPGDRMCFQ